MTRSHWFPVLLGSCLLVLPLSATFAQEEGGRKVVLAELFTSQGCSSCPPADRLLDRLDELVDDGVTVVPLSYHVDYWNYIGWTDPFAAPAWTDRQNRYARSLGNGSRIYTPQLVIDGRSDCVGSDVETVAEQLAAAAREPAAAAVDVTTTVRDGVLQVEAEAALLRNVRGGGPQLVVAVFDSDHETPVGSGENARRTLHNDYVVRRLETLASFEGASGTRSAGAVEIAVDPSWRRDSLGVVAFVQSKYSRRVHGSSAVNRPFAP